MLWNALASASPGPDPTPVPSFGYKMSYKPQHGIHPSGESLCAAVWSSYRYVRRAPYWGDCEWLQEDVGHLHRSDYIYNGYYCPTGFSLRGATAGDVSGLGNGPNLTCECDPSNGRYFGDVNGCMVPIKIESPPPNDPKNNGESCPSCGNPINPATGGKFQKEVDFVAAGPGGLALARFYNGNPLNLDAETVRSSGTRWTQVYDITVAQEAALTARTLCWKRPDNGYIWCERGAAPPAPTYNPLAASLTRADGKKYFFSKVDSVWGKDSDVNGTFTALYNASAQLSGWTFVNADGAVERFDVNGRIVSVTARVGTVQRFTYSTGTTNDSSQGRNPADAPVCSNVQNGAVLAEGRLLCVTDHWGKQLQYEYDAKGMVSKAIDPAGQSYLYEYDGVSAGCLNTAPESVNCKAKNLTKVTYPDGKYRVYHYNELANINKAVACPGATKTDGFGHLFNALTGITDENGTRYASWTYDCTGRAVSSEHAGGVDKVALAYAESVLNGERTTTVTSFTGNPAAPVASQVAYRFVTLNGVAKNVGIDQPCPNCGPTKSTMYDANGNPKTRVDRNGSTTTFAYDVARNLETLRIEAFDKPLARTTSTQWHVQFRLPEKIAEPLRITTLAYDLAGNLLSRTVQATSDKTGALKFTAPALGTSRKWTYTYNTVGQLKTLTGPRTDVLDKTSYDYDDAGNLSKITNSAGHITTLSSYDGNGRVGRITGPNNVVTDITYWPRGWVKTRKVGTELTSYDYDNVGQLIRVSAPGGAVLTYSYDDAHRLTGINDQLGNSIRYTLDLSGNRTVDQTKDPLGTVVRQTTRVFDNLNQLKEMTGAAQ